MSLSSLPTALLIPPINLVPLGLAGLALSRRWPRLGKGLAGLALAMLLLLAMPLTSGLLIASLEVGLPQDITAPKVDPPAAIVILGGDAAYGAPVGGIFPGSGIGALTLERMRAGVLLHRRTGLPILVTGDALEDGVTPIASQMAQALQDDFATPVQWIEPASADTWQNAQFSAVLLRQANIHSVYVVTHAWHMRRAMIAFARTGIAVTPAPIYLDRWPELSLDGFIPRVSSWLASYYALHEWIGCVYYALRR